MKSILERFNNFTANIFHFEYMLTQEILKIRWSNIIQEKLLYIFKTSSHKESAFYRPILRKYRAKLQNIFWSKLTDEVKCPVMGQTDTFQESAVKYCLEYRYMRYDTQQDCLTSSITTGWSTNIIILNNKKKNMKFYLFTYINATLLGKQTTLF